MTTGLAAGAALGSQDRKSSAIARIFLIGSSLLKNKKPGFPGSFDRFDRAACAAPRLDRLDVGGGRTLGALLHVERHLLGFLQGLVAVHLNRAVVGEQILAAVIRRDESETLGV